MSARTDYIYDSWAELLGGNDASGWLSAFIESPGTAVSDLLWSRFYFGALNPIDRDQLLINWLEILRDTENFAARLDREFFLWIEENWGRFNHGQPNQHATSLVWAWSCLFNVIDYSSSLPKVQLKSSADALRARFPMSRRFLGSFSTGPAADPLGLYLGVIAKFQEDRSLTSFWYNMCDLPEGVPFYHARYIMMGLRYLPATESSQTKKLSSEVVRGLLRLAKSFDRLLVEGRIPQNIAHIARATFERVAAQTVAEYPKSKSWGDLGLNEFWRLPERAKDWVRDSVPELAKAEEYANNPRNVQNRKPAGAFNVIRRDPTWAQTSQQLAARLKRGDLTALPEAETLLKAEGQYAEATGDAYDVTHSLRNLALSILTYAPPIARQWTEDALQWAPNETYSWNHLTTVLLYSKDYEAAATYAWVAFKRFPEDVVACTSLAEILEAKGQLDEAIDIYQQAVERFPDNRYACAGLAGVLTSRGRYKEAIAVYERGIKLFPSNNDFNYRGLARVWRNLGDYKKTERILRESIKKGFAGVATYSALASLLVRPAKGAAGRAEASILIEKVLQLAPNDRSALEFKRTFLRDHKRSAEEIDKLLNSWEQELDRRSEKEALNAIQAQDAPLEKTAPVDERADIESPYIETPIIEDATSEIVAPVVEVKPVGELKTDVTEGEAEVASIDTTLASPEQPEPASQDVAPPATKPKPRAVPKAPPKSAVGKVEAAQESKPAPQPPPELQSQAESQPEVEPELKPEPVPEPDRQPRPQLEAESQWVPQPAPPEPEKQEPNVTLTASVEPKNHAAAKITVPPLPPPTLIPEYYDSFDLFKVAALVAEANFYRLRAKRVDPAKGAEEQVKATALIEEATKIAPNDPQVLSEHAALLMDTGKEKDPLERVSVLYDDHSSSVPVLALKARLDRERAERDKTYLTDQTLADIVRMPVLLGDVDSLEPLSQFQKGMAALALLDGYKRMKAAADAFSGFRRKLATHVGSERLAQNDLPRFYEWLERQVNTQIFAGLGNDESTEIHPDQVSTLDERWKTDRRAFEGVEAVFVDRFVYRSI